jgi:hypothetical protein
MGYSATPLVKKLGLKPGIRAIFINSPEHYAQTLGPLPPGIEFGATLKGQFDFIQLFTTQRADLEARLPELKAALAKSGMLWISWPKKAAKVATDITEDVLREVILPQGLVDVKVIAVDNVWSGLKFVFRVENR